MANSANILNLFFTNEIILQKITCPLLALWAGRGLYPRLFDDVLGIWKEEGTKVSGKAVDGTHNLQESAPKETLAELLAFLKS